MKIMISQPMKGKTNEQIREQRAELVTRLQEEGLEVVDTVFENAPADEDIAIYMLSQCPIKRAGTEMCHIKGSKEAY